MIKSFNREVIEDALKNANRVYLTGRLSRPQTLDAFSFSEECIVCHYKETLKEDAHIHSYNNDYIYVVEGELTVKELMSGEETVFRKGDFFIIEKGTPHQITYQEGTKTFSVKIPGGNDKVLVYEEILKAPKKIQVDTAYTK